jgi:arylamine N-acetyltransferase
MTNSVDDAINDRFTELFNSSKFTPVESAKEKRTYYIEVDDNTHWELVRIAARNKQHQEDFVEQLLVEFVAGVQAANAANKVK